jgi:hypothetical protein
MSYTAFMSIEFAKGSSKRTDAEHLLDNRH